MTFVYYIKKVICFFGSVSVRLLKRNDQTKVTLNFLKQLVLNLFQDKLFQGLGLEMLKQIQHDEIRLHFSIFRLYVLVVCVFIPAVFFGQFQSNDPYRLNFSYLNFEQSKEEIVSHNIKKVTSFYCSDKQKEPKPSNQIYYAEFDKNGNPVHYFCRDAKPGSSGLELRQKLGFKKAAENTCRYSFLYDTLHRLVDVKESISEKNISHENDVHFLYRENNRVAGQTHTNKKIYKPGVKFRNARNDTTLIDYAVNYNAKNNVTNIIKRQSSSEPPNITVNDTIVYNCAFDSIFISRESPKGIKIDRNHGVIEETVYAPQVPANGKTSSEDGSPEDLKKKHFYDGTGKLVKEELYLRDGTFISRQLWKYNDKGLLESVRYEDASEYVCYSYEYY